MGRRRCECGTRRVTRRAQQHKIKKERGIARKKRKNDKNIREVVFRKKKKQHETKQKRAWPTGGRRMTRESRIALVDPALHWLEQTLHQYVRVFHRTTEKMHSFNFCYTVCDDIVPVIRHVVCVLFKIYLANLFLKKFEQQTSKQANSMMLFETNSVKTTDVTCRNGHLMSTGRIVFFYVSEGVGVGLTEGIFFRMIQTASTKTKKMIHFCKISKLVDFLCQLAKQL